MREDGDTNFLAAVLVYSQVFVICSVRTAYVPEVVCKYFVT